MPGTRPKLRIVLTVLVAAGLAAAVLSFTSRHSGSAPDPRLALGTHSGHANDDARVVLDAVGDHADLGVCARRNPEAVSRSWSAPLVALPAALLAGNAGCGRRVEVSNADGTTVTATVVGSCDGCSGEDITVSPALFHQLAGFGQFTGAITVSWRYVS